MELEYFLMSVLMFIQIKKWCLKAIQLHYWRLSAESWCKLSVVLWFQNFLLSYWVGKKYSLCTYGRTLKLPGAVPVLATANSGWYAKQQSLWNQFFVFLEKYANECDDFQAKFTQFTIPLLLVFLPYTTCWYVWPLMFLLHYANES